MEPQDQVEVMLVSQMTAAHNAGINLLSWAMSDGPSLKGRDLYLRYATRFLSLYAKQVETVAKGRKARGASPLVVAEQRYNSIDRSCQVESEPQFA